MIGIKDYGNSETSATRDLSNVSTIAGFAELVVDIKVNQTASNSQNQIVPESYDVFDAFQLSDPYDVTFEILWEKRFQ